MEDTGDRDFVPFTGRGNVLGASAEPPGDSQAVSQEVPPGQLSPEASQSQADEGASAEDPVQFSLYKRLQVVIDVAAHWQERFEHGSSMRSQIDDYLVNCVECVTSPVIDETRVRHFEEVLGGWKTQMTVIASAVSGSAQDRDDDGDASDKPPFETDNAQVDEFLNDLEAKESTDVEVVVDDDDSQPLLPPAQTNRAQAQKRKAKSKAKAKAIKKRRIAEKGPKPRR